MADITPPRDAFGNELKIGDVVVYQSAGILAYKIVEIQNGGIHTNQGKTPCLIRLITDVTIMSPPGMLVNNIGKVVQPGAEEALQRILSATPPPKV